MSAFSGLLALFIDLLKAGVLTHSEQSTVLTLTHSEYQRPTSVFVAGGKKGREDGTKLVNEADGPRPNPTEIPSPTEAPGETSIEHK